MKDLIGGRGSKKVKIRCFKFMSLLGLKFKTHVKLCYFPPISPKEAHCKLPSSKFQEPGKFEKYLLILPPLSPLFSSDHSCSFSTLVPFCYALQKPETKPGKNNKIRSLNSPREVTKFHNLLPEHPLSASRKLAYSLSFILSDSIIAYFTLIPTVRSPFLCCN